MAPLEMEEYKDFVLKLKIKAVDGTSQIRRMRLPQIADATGNLSYEELVGLVVTFHFPEGSPENFNCSLTYFDEDEDAVTIASNAELVDAVEQFADKKVLRISTEVQPKTSPAATPRPAASAAQPPEASGNRTDRGTSTAADPDIHPQIQNVLESVVGILVTAVNSIEKGLSAPPASGASSTRTPAPEEKPKATETFARKKVENLAAASPPCMEFAVGNAGTKPVTTFVHSRHTCDSCLKTPVVGKRYHAVNQEDYDLCENCFKNYSGKQTHFVEHPSEKKIEKFFKVVSKPAPPKEAAKAPVSKPAPPKEATKAPEPPAGTKPEPAPAPEQEDEENLPFIHGRHTCDSCLKTPIVGKRFHATNIKDYDVCASCQDKHSGTEIQFEAVELPRDRAFQMRWNRRRRRIEYMKGGTGGRRRGPRNGRRPPVATTPPPSPPYRSEDSPARIIPIQTSATAPEQSDDFDGALKEAIRRSLEDAMPTETTDPESSKEMTAVVEPSAPAEEELEATKESSTVSAEKMPKNESAVEEILDVPEFAPINLTESPIASAPEDVDEKFLLEMMDETMSVDSADMVAEDDFDKKLAAVSIKASTASPERKPAPVELGTSDASPKSVTDDSFALDAVGNGDVAEAMGATLDIVAGVISEMLSEADSHNNPKPREETAQVEDKEPEQEVEKDTAGALILTAEDKVGDAEETEDDWEVVNENVDEDTDIANATQMLGSALFNSDIKSSVENVSVLTNSDCFSDAASVPSTVLSIHLGTDVSTVAPAQRNRWALQLEKLHELGFDDEKQCVETLERLQAANIGCDEEDEISVTQVVNAILEQK